MEGNEIEKAARKHARVFTGYLPADDPRYESAYNHFTAGANWQKERDEHLKKEVERLKDELSKRLIDFKEWRNVTIQQLQSELTRANAKVEELSQWKESQIKLWLPVMEWMERNGNLKIGESISGEVLRKLKIHTGKE